MGRQQLSLPSSTFSQPRHGCNNLLWWGKADLPPHPPPLKRQNQLGDIALSDEQDGLSATRDREEEQQTDKKDASSLLSYDAARLAKKR